MNIIKKCLTLILSVIACASLQTFTMEKEKSHANDEWLKPIGNTSNELGREDRMLVKRINQLKKFNTIILDILLYHYNAISSDKYIKLEQLQVFTQQTIAIAHDMYRGRTPVNIKFITQNLQSINNQWNELASSSESSELF